MEDEPTLEYIARFVAETQQSYTQKGGVRPFGISTFIAGFQDKEPRLYVTEPSGAYSLWKAQAIGKGSKTLREYLEKHYKENSEERACVKLAVQTLMEVVENSRNIEVCVIGPDNKMDLLEEEAVEKYVKEVEKDREEANQQKQGGAK